MRAAVVDINADLNVLPHTQLVLHEPNISEFARLVETQGSAAAADAAEEAARALANVSAVAAVGGAGSSHGADTCTVLLAALAARLRRCLCVLAARLPHPSRARAGACCLHCALSDSVHRAPLRAARRLSRLAAAREADGRGVV
mgnify:CR=1 FL=1